MADLEDMMDGVFELFDNISDTVTFQAAGFPLGITGHLSEASGEIVAPDGVGKGPKKLKIKAKLAVSRTRAAKAPAYESIITHPDGTNYRVGAVAVDGAGWLLTLCTP